MTGGTIARNHNKRAGGGLYAESTDDFRVTGGRIIDNISDNLGGGIYVSSNASTSVFFENTLVENNHASFLGGGMWCCPTSTAKVSVTEGVAIFDNTCASDDGSPRAGDDFVTVDIPGKQGAKVSVAPRMLGGGFNSFHQDGSFSMDPNIENLFRGCVFDPSAGRFNPSNPGDAVTIDSKPMSRALKNIVTDAAKASARASAKVVISGNKAAMGGGIATNETFFGGKEDNEWTLEVAKVWKDIDPSVQTSVPVFLKVNGQVLDYVLLTPENGYKATFMGLPDPTTVESFEVVEGSLNDAGEPTLEASSTWEVHYGELSLDKTHKTATITIENAKPEEPPTPEPPTPPEPHPAKPAPPTSDPLGAGALALAVLGGMAACCAGLRLRTRRM